MPPLLTELHANDRSYRSERGTTARRDRRGKTVQLLSLRRYALLSLWICILLRCTMHRIRAEVVRGFAITSILFALRNPLTTPQEELYALRSMEFRRLSARSLSSHTRKVRNDPGGTERPDNVARTGARACDHHSTLFRTVDVLACGTCSSRPRSRVR